MKFLPFRTISSGSLVVDTDTEPGGDVERSSLSLSMGKRKKANGEKQTFHFDLSKVVNTYMPNKRRSPGFL